MKTILIVSCTQRKRYDVLPELRLGHFQNLSLKEKFRAWTKALTKFGSERHSAKDTYAGDHWAVVRSIEERVSDVEICVCSAGYGLISLSEEIVPYSATFSLGRPDSVSNNTVTSQPSKARRFWWSCLTSGDKVLNSERCRSIAQLASQSPDSCLMVVASRNYLDAIYEDLFLAAKILGGSKRLLIVSAGTKTLGELNPFLVPCDARLQAVVGGVRLSLNARIARYILEHLKTSDDRLGTVQEKLKELTEGQDALASWDRKVVNDQEIKRFIQKSFRSNPQSTHSALLRIFRDDGRACEYKRFRSLFQEVKTANSSQTTSG